MSLRKIHPDMIDESFRQDISKEINDKIDAVPLEKTKADIIKETNDRIEELKAQLDANKYVHPETHPASMIVQDINNRFVTDNEKSTWNNKANNSVVTTTANGLMTKEDKAKLNGIEEGATSYTHPDTHPASMIVEDANHRFITDAEISKLNNIEVGANKYVHPSTHPATMITQDSSNRFVTDSEKNTWNNKANNSIATTGVDGLMSSEDKTKLNGIATGATNTTVENALTSTSASNALSAYQGKLLNDKVSALETKAVKLNNIGQTSVVTSATGTAFGSQTTANGIDSLAEGRRTTASGQYAHAEGVDTVASGNYSHAEGNGAKATGSQSHAEGGGTTASGNYSHAEGWNTKTTKYASHAEGYITEANGDYSHAEGRATKANGVTSHAEGDYTTASGEASHAEGYNTTASGEASHAEGYNTVASGRYGSHAEGSGTLASGQYSHAEGSGTTATALASHAEGYLVTASGEYSHAEGRETVASGEASHAQGNETMALGSTARTSGYATLAGFGNVYEIQSINDTNKTITLKTPYPTSINTSITSNLYVVGSYYGNSGDSKTVTFVSYSNGIITYSGNLSMSSNVKYNYVLNLTSENSSATASGVATVSAGYASSSEGRLTVASGSYSHAEGSNTTASGEVSHAEGYYTVASGIYSHAGGANTTANVHSSTAIGRYNKTMSGSATSILNSSDIFVIGNGNLNTKSNAFRVTLDGRTYGMSAFNSTGADYAEYFEWADGNEENEDRVGYFVSIDGEKIRKSNSTDKYIIGVISVNPSVIGDSWQDEWNDKYMRDEWGRIQHHYVDSEPKYIEVPTGKLDDEGIEIYETINVNEGNKDYIPILNPNWNPDKEYIPREKRKEWSPVGLMGKLLLRDDGTCQVNGFCKPNDEGVATASEENTGYRVMKRVSEDMIYVFIK